tara:strand:- start:1303 stop:2817 length:1515 start_codon:yes stop_codon:yes gene_type:complete
MANFDAQIQALAGTIPVTANALQWFNDGMKDVVNRYMIINPKMLAMLSAEQTPITDSGGSNVIDSTLIVSVRRGEKIATEISPFDRFDAKSTTSLKRATNDHPKYYVLNGYLFILPNPENTSGNKGYVDVVTYPSNFNSLSTNEISGFPKEWFRLPVLYASIKVLHERMVAYSAELPSDIVLPSVPVSPSLSLTLTETFSTLSFPSSLVLPSFVGVPEPSFPDLDLSTITAPASLEIPVFVANKVTMPSTPPAYSSVSFTPPVMEPLDFTKLTFYIETEEDPELATSQIQKINAKVQKFQTEANASLQEYQSNMQNQLNIFNDANAEYQAEMQKAIQDAQSSNQKDVQEYSSKIQKQAQDVSIYQANINKAVQEYTIEEVQIKLAKYQMQIGNAINEYQAKIGSALQEHSALVAKESAKTQAEVNRIASEVQKRSQIASVEIQDYSAKLSAYQAETGSLMQQFNAHLQKTNTEYQWMAGQLGYLMQEYEKGFVPIQPPQPKEEN